MAAHYDLFLSYAQADDEPFVKRLYSDLTARGFAVWWDRQSMPNRGLTFLQEIRDAVEASDRLIAVIGPQAVASDYVRAEWAHALLFAKGVVPVLRSGDYGLVPPELFKLDCPDFRKKEWWRFWSYRKALRKLVSILQEPIQPLRPLHTEGPAPSRCIFISYARKDGAELAQQLQASLGSGAWLDTHRIRGGASWTRAIEEAIDRCDVQLALLSQGSFESNICRSEQVRALRKGKLVIPILVHSRADIPLHLDGLHYLDFTDRSQYDSALETLRSQMQSRQTGPLKPKWQKTTTSQALPDLPGNFVPRPRDLDRLRQALLGEESKPLTALWGMVGVGKTVLAQALCRDQVVQEAFPDGVVWVKLSQQPDLAGRLREVGQVLEDDFPKAAEYYSTQEGSIQRLRQLMPDKAVLIVLDNVFEADHVEPFWAGGSRCRLLFTTQDLKVAVDLHAEIVELRTMAPPEAVALLAKGAQPSDPHLPDIARRLGFLPLALRLAAARMRMRKTGKDWLANFHHVSQIKMGHSCKDPKDNLEVCFDLSLDLLPAEDRELYYTLGIFPHEAKISEEVVARLWPRLQPKLTPFDCLEILSDFRRLALIETDPPDVLHDLLYDYCRGKLGDRLHEMNSRLLRAYNLQARPWREVAADDYLYRHLAYHLMEAGRPDELIRTLWDYGWLRAKLNATDVNALIADYDLLSEDKDLTILQRALRLSAHVLFLDKKQLPGQFAGRLLGVANPAIVTFLENIRKIEREYWLCPITASLDSPGGPLLRTLTGHSDKVTAVALTPDGRLAVSGSWDQTLKVWNLETGQEPRTLPGHTGWIQSVALTPDGRRAVSGSWDTTLKVWDLEKREVLRTLKGHTKGINTVALTPDGRRAVSGSDDQTLKVWNLETGEVFCSLNGHTGGVHAVALTSDGRRAVSAYRDRTLKVWDLETEQELRTLSGHTDWVRAVALTSDGRRALSGSDDKTLKFWDLETGQELRTLSGHSEWVQSVALTPDGRRAVSGSWDETLKIWDLESGKEIRSLPGYTGLVWAVALPTDGKRAISGSSDKTLKVWDLETDQELPPPRGNTSRVDTLALTPGGHRAVSGSAMYHTLDVWDLEAGQFGYTSREESLALPTAGRQTLSGSTDQTRQIWGLKPGQEVRTLHGHELRITALALTPNGHRAVSSSADKTLKVWDLQTGKELHTLHGHSDWVEAVAVNPEGHRVVSGSRDKTLKVWDLETGMELHTLNGHENSVETVAMTPDGGRAVSGCWDGTLKVWDLETERVVHTLIGHSSRVSTMALTFDSHWAVSGSWDKTLKIWDLETGEFVRTLTGHTREVQAVAVTPDGRRIVSASWDWTLRVWDLATGVGLATFTGDSAILACAAAPDNRTFVAGEVSGRVHFLRLEGAENL